MLGDLYGVPGRHRRLGPGHGDGRSTCQKTWRRNVPGHHGPARGRDRHGGGDLVRAALHRATPATRRRAPAVREGQAPRVRARVRRPGVPAGRCGDPAARRPDRAGLPADPRPDGRPPPPGHARGARPGRPRLPGVPARRHPRRGGPARIAEALEAAHYPTDFEARDAALRRLAFDELLALQLGMVARRRARGRARTEPLPVDPTPDRRIRDALAASLSRKLDREVALTADQAVAHRRDPRRPRPPGPDAAPGPGRRRVGQDRGRGVGAGGRGARRPPGRAPRAHRPPGTPARGDPGGPRSRTWRSR